LIEADIGVGGKFRMRGREVSRVEPVVEASQRADVTLRI
jgi:hypothetical protein